MFIPVFCPLHLHNFPFPSYLSHLKACAPHQLSLWHLCQNKHPEVGYWRQPCCNLNPCWCMKTTNNTKCWNTIKNHAGARGSMFVCWFKFKVSLSIMHCTSPAHFKIFIGGPRKPAICLELQGSKIKNFTMLWSAEDTKGRGVIGLDTLSPASVGLVLQLKWNGNILVKIFIEQEVNPDLVHSVALKIRQKIQKSPDFSWHSQRPFLIEEDQGKQVWKSKIHFWKSKIRFWKSKIQRKREKNPHQMILPWSIKGHRCKEKGHSKYSIAWGLQRDSNNTLNNQCQILVPLEYSSNNWNKTDFGL